MISGISRSLLMNGNNRILRIAPASIVEHGMARARVTAEEPGVGGRLVNLKTDYPLIISNSE